MAQIIEVTGRDARKLLQGLVTNDVERIDRGPVYAALLTPQGKYLADFLMLARGEAVWLDTHDALADGLAQRLGMYRLRSDAAISVIDIPVARGVGPAPEGALPDPRHEALGWRLYGQEAADGADWDAIRVEHLIPEAGAELIPNESYVLEMGFERLGGVDFRKGCYVGQEVTARMKHKTTLKKGLARVRLSGEAAPGTPIEADGRPVGTLHTRSGDRALAYLRFDRASGEMSAGGVRVVLDEPVAV